MVWGLFVQVQDEEGWITFFPGAFANLTFGIDHRLVAPIIGDMWFTFHSDDTHFRCAAPLFANAQCAVVWLLLIHAPAAGHMTAGFVQWPPQNMAWWPCCSS